MSAAVILTTRTTSRLYQVTNSEVFQFMIRISTRRARGCGESKVTQL